MMVFRGCESLSPSLKIQTSIHQRLIYIPDSLFTKLAKDSSHGQIPSEALAIRIAGGLLDAWVR